MILYKDQILTFNSHGGVVLNVGQAHVWSTLGRQWTVTRPERDNVTFDDLVDALFAVLAPESPPTLTQEIGL